MGMNQILYKKNSYCKQSALQKKISAIVNMGIFSNIICFSND